MAENGGNRSRRPYEDEWGNGTGSLSVQTLGNGRIQFLAADGNQSVIAELTVGDARELSAIFGAAADIASLEKAG